ncbi:S9 family peptidase [Alistipes sp. OttesenSCG-928-B03]|nr:S9 family peptidase [Alistipes sp. OttesenSCG-928-B03]
MKLKQLAMMCVAAGSLASCGGEKEAPKQEAKPLNMVTEMTAEEKAAGVLTPEVMYKMGRVGGSAMSPDGATVAYTVSYYSVAENRSETSIYLLTLADGTTRRLTDAVGSDNSPVWSADGQTIYYASNRSGSNQLWKMNADGTAQTQISNIEDGFDSFGIAPAGNRAFYTKSVQVEKFVSGDVYPDMKESKALIYDDLMARHWNYWDRGSYSHIFLADMHDGQMQPGVDIMPGEPWDAPLAPYFDAAEIAWNNAGTQLAYTCKKLTGTEYALSTDSDIYLYDIASGTTTNLTKGMVGYDKYPVFSPDGSRIAFTSMERPGNEADKERIFVMNIDGSDKRYLAQNFDYNAHGLKWFAGGAALLFIAPIEATHQLCCVDMDSNVSVITNGDHDINAFTFVDGRAVAEVTRITMATELFSIEITGGEMAQVTNVNKHIYDNVGATNVEKRWITTTDGKKMLTWVIYPPDFDPAKKYPTLLYCQGGPQSVVSQAWSYRWNHMLMASQGYIVVAPNRRGLPSFGQEWLDQISGDYSGQNIRDYLSAIDNVSREPWSDETRLGCVGASYGGYSSFYLAGVHQKRFKAFIAHCGIFNFESMYGSTEELFFPTNDYGGPYWDKANKVAQRSYDNSPHKIVDRWDTPILIIAGLNDFRVPYTQSLEAFTAARVQGVPARLVAFENEAHQVFKPQNAIVWNREFFGWLDKYVKNAQ